MLNMSTMSYIKLSITVFQEQQNGETNILGLLTAFRCCWVIRGGSWPKSHSSSISTSDRQDSESPWAWAAHGHLDPWAPCHSCPGPAAPSCRLPPLLLLQTQHTPTPKTDTATPGWGQTVLWLFSSNYFFFLKNHLSCYTTRQESLRLW